MAGDKSLDAFLEMLPSKTMSVKALGESLDAQKNASQMYGAISIKSFRLSKSGGGGTGSSLDGGDDEDGKNAKQMKQMAAKLKKLQIAQEKADDAKGGKNEREFGFSITKDIDASSPFLFRAYCSNSYKPKRPRFNAFDQAKVSFRKLGASGDSPTVYLVFTFGMVYVSGFSLKADGAQPPQETVNFKALACTMTYTRQASDGTMSAQPIEGGMDLTSFSAVGT